MGQNRLPKGDNRQRFAKVSNPSANTRAHNEHITIWLLGCYIWSQQSGSNRRPVDYKSVPAVVKFVSNYLSTMSEVRPGGPDG